MKFGFRIPSLRKRIAARTSLRANKRRIVSTDDFSILLRRSSLFNKHSRFLSAELRLTAQGWLVLYPPIPSPVLGPRIRALDRCEPAR